MKLMRAFLKATMVCVALVPAVTGQMPGSSFGSPVGVTTGSVPISIATGLLNCDSLPDIVTCNRGGGSITVALATSTTTYGTPNTFVVAGSSNSNPTAVAVGDTGFFLGNADIACLCNGSYSLSTTPYLVLVPNNGCGSFGTPTNISLGGAPLALGGPKSVAVGNLGTNSAPVPGVVYVDSGNNTLNVFQGGSTTPIVIGVSTNPFAVAIGHFTSLTQFDVVVVGQSGIDLIPGPITIASTPTTTTPTNAGPLMLAVADFNGDGFADVATSTIAGVIDTYVGSAGGLVPTLYTNFTPGFGQWSMVAGDHDGDGVVDLALVDLSGGVTIMRGMEFPSFNPESAVSMASSQPDIAFADADQNGQLDIFVTGPSGTAATVYYNSTANNLSFTTSLDLFAATTDTLTTTNPPFSTTCVISLQTAQPNAATVLFISTPPPTTGTLFGGIWVWPNLLSYTTISGTTDGAGQWVLGPFDSTGILTGARFVMQSLTGPAPTFSNGVLIQ